MKKSKVCKMLELNGFKIKKNQKQPNIQKARMIRIPIPNLRQSYHLYKFILMTDN